MSNKLFPMPFAWPFDFLSLLLIQILFYFYSITFIIYVNLTYESPLHVSLPWKIAMPLQKNKLFSLSNACLFCVKQLFVYADKVLLLVYFVIPKLATRYWVLTETYSNQHLKKRILCYSKSSIPKFNMFI